MTETETEVKLKTENTILYKHDKNNTAKLKTKQTKKT